MYEFPFVSLFFRSLICLYSELILCCANVHRTTNAAARNTRRKLKLKINNIRMKAVLEKRKRAKAREIAQTSFHPWHKKDITFW